MSHRDTSKHGCARTFLTFIAHPSHSHKTNYSVVFQALSTHNTSGKQRKVSTKYSIKVLIMLLQQVHRQKRTRTKAGVHNQVLARTKVGMSNESRHYINKGRCYTNKGNEGGEGGRMQTRGRHENEGAQQHERG